jgi:hypothetical protein
MKPRHLLMGAGLVAAAALFAFGDNTPDSGVAEPVQRAVVRAQGLGAPAFANAVVPAQAKTYAESARPGTSPPPVTGELSMSSRLRGNDAVVQAAAAKGAPHILRLKPRHALIGAGGLGESGDVFVSHDWTPPPPPPPVAPPPPPPSAPPLPFTYIGKAFENGAWEVYLAHAGKTFIVQPKTVIDGMYRVDAIAPPILTLTYLPLNQVQQLNIGEFD